MCGGGYAPPQVAFLIIGAAPLNGGTAPLNFTRSEGQRPSAHQAAQPNYYSSRLPEPPLEYSQKRQFPESPRTLTTNETKRKASRPANALSATVIRNSIPSARFFGTIMGRASIFNIKPTTSSLFPLPEFAAWTTITSDLPAKFLRTWFLSGAA
jgi:hypothetical protein